MKKILLATVATSVLAAPAFANMAVDNAVTAINDVYTKFEGLDTDGDLKVIFGELLYKIDNHGSVDTVSLDATGDAIDIDYAGMADDLPGITIDLYDFSDDFDNLAADIVDEIQEQFYGSTDNDENTWTISHDVNGVFKSSANGFISQEVDLLATKLNTLEDHIEGVNPTEWNAMELENLDTNVEDVSSYAKTLSGELTDLVNATSTFGSYDHDGMDAPDWRLRGDESMHYVSLSSSEGIAVTMGGTAVTGAVSMTDGVYSYSARSADEDQATYDTKADFTQPDPTPGS